MKDKTKTKRRGVTVGETKVDLMKLGQHMAKHYI